MALKIFKNKGESGAIPLNAENLNYNFNEILNLVYPIGRGFIDFTDTDYSNYLGFTWERELVGMTAVGLDTTQTEFNSVGKIGGEKTHTLTVSEMPNHTHTLYYYGTEGHIIHHIQQKWKTLQLVRLLTVLTFQQRIQVIINLTIIYNLIKL